MGCPCKDKAKKAAAAEQVAAPAVASRPATSVRLELTVRGEGHPLACEDCLVKHVGVAYVLSGEWLEDETRKTERLLCIANLQCAAEHAEALGRKSLASLLDEARVLFARDGEASKIVLVVDELCGADERERQRLVAIGHMAAAEQAMRLCDGDSFADRVRAVRLDWTAETRLPATGVASEETMNNEQEKEVQK